MAVSDWEPLLPDDRIGKIAELLRVAFPELPQDADVFSFVIPEQKEANRASIRGAPHERGCLWVQDTALPCECEPLNVPEQVVFAVKAKHPRDWEVVYKDKEIMSTSAMPRARWDAVEKARSHYVSAREDPAFGPLAIAARSIVQKIRDYRELI